MSVTESGPFFDTGRWEGAMNQIREESQAAIGEHGVMLVRRELGASLRHPTGYYNSRIQQVDRVESTLINDGGVVYGPWLEGVGSRNKTSRFKGYATYRRVTQRLQRDGVRITTEIVVKVMRGFQ